MTTIRERVAEELPAHLRRHIAYRDRRALLALVDELVGIAGMAHRILPDDEETDDPACPICRALAHAKEVTDG